MTKAGERIFDDLLWQRLQLIDLHVDMEMQPSFSLTNVFRFNYAMLFQNMPPALPIEESRAWLILTRLELRAE
ncbi:hypothetical protein F9K77_02410 [Ochrobactrum sp. LMG 5442]|nr:hypothetical protein F9K77_02410 [Ochrobactrum sp. LMG 5442]